MDNRGCIGNPPAALCFSARALRYRAANSIVAWLLTGVVAAVSFFGTGLHQILGVHHGADSGPDSQIGAHPTTAAVEIQKDGRQDGACDEANCPICSYLAQARVVGERFEALAVTVNLPNPTGEIPLFLPTPDLHPFQARAPPAV